MSSVKPIPKQVSVPIPEGLTINDAILKLVKVKMRHRGSISLGVNNFNMAVINLYCAEGIEETLVIFLHGILAGIKIGITCK